MSPEMRNAEPPHPEEIIRRGSIELLAQRVKDQAWPGYPPYEERIQADNLLYVPEQHNVLLPTDYGWVNQADLADASFRKEYPDTVTQFDAEGRPLHPWFWDMLQSEAGVLGGKGAYWEWGPNYTADPIIVRHDLEEPHVLLIQRSDTHGWALPGGFVDPGETGFYAAMREAGEETGPDIQMALRRPGVGMHLVYQGPVADLRATAHAWPETTAVRFDIPDHVATEHLLEMQWEGNDEAGEIEAVAWVPLSEIGNRLHGSHRFLIETALAA
ncbi:MAG TPA: NUDIX domain-containing protein [Verrucomicrobiae bacterium]|nr:NUDIX domain-containing protein [Verrucomicrobiae bacterium]